MGFFNFLRKNKDIYFISEEEKEDFMNNNPRGKDLTELNEYTEKLIKKESKFIGSNRGYLLCPVCGEEFKDKENLFSHLRNNRREFATLPIEFNYKFEYQKSYGWGKEGGTAMSFGNVKIIFSNLNNSLGGMFNFTINPRQGTQIDYDLDKIKNIINLEVLKYKLYLVLEEEKYKEWEKSKPKSNQRENPVPQKIRFEILKRDNFTCQYCGKKSPEVELEVDHIEPYSKTKNNNPENLISSCKDCNRGKRTKEVI
ncbi:MAG: HNH endonuclease [Nanoarchaeota archaeon]